MSTAIVKPEVSALTAEQKELIKRTVAAGCTDDELQMFLHVAAKSGLDPLLKQIHCTKMGGRLAFIADINGLQARAAREPDYEGLEHAVVFEKDTFSVDQKSGEVVEHISNPFANGRPIGAWAVVYRAGKKPFRSMVRFDEYNNQNNPLWKSKPGVMIDKVAKSTALRLAYPEQLGGIYSAEELGREEKEINPPAPKLTAKDAAKAKAQVFESTKELAASNQQTEELIKKAEKSVDKLKVNPHWQRIEEALVKANKVGKSGADFVRGVTGKTNRDQVTQEDAQKVIDALGALGMDVVEPPEPQEEPEPNYEGL